MKDGPALERLIGRLASLAGPPPGLVAWASTRESELFVVPVLPGALLNESIKRIGDWGHTAGALVTARESAAEQGFRLVWLAAEAVESHGAPGDCHLPTTPSTTVADLLRILEPGASVTLRLGNDEVFLQPDATSEPIEDETLIQSLRALATG